jgi:hypothetical protein
MNLSPDLSDMDFKPLPDLSDADKSMAAALWSWLQNHRFAAYQDFETAYRRIKRLAEKS